MTFLSKYGAARHIYVPMVKRAVVDHAVGADWTPSAGDVKISKDGGAAANVTNLPTAIAMGNSALWDFSLTATEMEAAQIVVTVADSATKAVEDNGFVIETYGHASAQHAVDLDDGVRAGLTALPNAAADAAGGLPISDAGGLDMDAILADTADMQPKLGTPAGASVSADIAAVKVDTAAILVDTGTTLDGKIDAIDNFIDTEIADIQARLPAALTAGGNMKVDVLAISGSTAAADTLELSTEAICTGTCDTGGSTTSIIASALSPASAVNDQFNGRIMIFNSDTTTAALRNQATDITDFVHATQTFTVTALTTAPASGDTFIIV